jgi:hypothetical protein
LPVQAVTRLVWLPCPKERRFAAAGLAAVVVLAILLRVVPTVLMPSAVWPDEIFQASEQAFRLVYGSGLIPWEFQFGARSWLLPGVIAVLMELARIAGDGPDYYLPLIAIAFAGLAALPVACCFLWCRRLFGFSGAVFAGMAVATAPELVYFGARTLSEVAAGHLPTGRIRAFTPISISQGFTPLRCFGLVCVGRRHGGCHPVTQMPMPVPDALAQRSAVRTAGSEAPKSGGDFGE